MPLCRPYFYPPNTNFVCFLINGLLYSYYQLSMTVLTKKELEFLHGSHLYILINSLSFIISRHRHHLDPKAYPGYQENHQVVLIQDKALNISISVQNPWLLSPCNSVQFPRLGNYFFLL